MNEWILFAQMFDADEDLCICKLKQCKDLNKEEMALIKKSEENNYTLTPMQRQRGIQSMVYFPPDRISKSRTEISTGPKQALENEMRLYKKVYPKFKQVSAVPMKPETAKHFGDIMNLH